MAQPTTAFELFFDLVYVFAVTQLSHLVIDGHLSLESIGRAAFLLIVVWWAWIYTTWMVNWFDPRTTGVRVVLSGVALANLLMSAAIPTAFTRHAALFAGAYVALQVGRNLSATLMLGRHEPLRGVFERNLTWSCTAGTLWIAGALVSAPNRIALWAPALAVDLLAPLVGYRTPGLGRSRTADWPVEGGPLRRPLPGVHHHRAWRVDRDHRRDRVRLRMISSISPQRLLAVIALGVLGGLGQDLSALALSAWVAAILIGLTLWDHERFRPRSGPFAWITVHQLRRGRR